MFTRSVGWAGVILAALLLSAPLPGLAGPRVLEESAKISAPDPTYDFPVSIAVDGDWLIASGWKWTTDEWSDQDHSVWLFQRQSNGTWAVVRRLVQHIDAAALDEPPLTLDMQGGVAVV